MEAKLRNLVDSLSDEEVRTILKTAIYQEKKGGFDWGNLNPFYHLAKFIFNDARKTIKKNWNKSNTQRMMDKRYRMYGYGSVWNDFMNRFGERMPELHYRSPFKGFKKHNYTGPFTKLDHRLKKDPNTGLFIAEPLNASAEPVNDVDRLAMHHDVAYQSPELADRHKADEVMLKGLNKIIKDKKQKFGDRFDAFVIKAPIWIKRKLGLGKKGGSISKLTTTDALKMLTVKQLRSLAKAFDVKNVSKSTKEDLVKKLPHYLKLKSATGRDVFTLQFSEKKQPARGSGKGGKKATKKPARKSAKRQTIEDLLNSL